ncbi:SRPBCC domain-containing protein [Phycicoccus sp. CSK15P-2]|uniref:SRPBCC domain-containing protein n=1 Tax=Phycicoccus sp. CSK15P-2 TaxID=2807627 RepID=UPI00194E83B9|nr:SRPBCC domain-containing protein [Phycicoccus sp. CSK15P-2]MBM6404846.1 SRPBCC domain-containing protein [Phycicoccus sp. CSK15P-2]
MTDDTTTDAPERDAPEMQVFRVYIEATAQQVWDGITSSEFTTRYGYGGGVDYDLTPGGDYVAHTTEQMKEMGMGDVAVTGRVLEADPPRRLVQTWVAAWHGEETTLTWELTEYPGPLTGLTLTHDCTGAQNTARDVEGTGDAIQGGGGWPWVLAGLKTLLETGRPMVGSGG